MNARSQYKKGERTGCRQGPPSASPCAHKVFHSFELACKFERLPPQQQQQHQLLPLSIYSFMHGERFALHPVKISWKVTWYIESNSPFCIISGARLWDAAVLLEENQTTYNGVTLLFLARLPRSNATKYTVDAITWFFLAHKTYSC